MANDPERRVLRVLDHIHATPSADLSPDALADVVANSRFHCHQVFRAVNAETAAQTVRRIRIHRAAVAAVSGTQTLQVVAASVGYPDPTSFARAFRFLCGMRPAAFRQRGELRPVLSPHATEKS